MKKCEKVNKYLFHDCSRNPICIIMQSKCKEKLKQ